MRKQGGTILRNDGAGAFAVSSRLPKAAGFAGPRAVADVDDDGDLDVVGFAGAGKDKTLRRGFVVLHNDGRAGFGTPAVVLAPAADPYDYPGGIAVGDVDSDGDADVAVTYESTRVVWVWRSDGRGGFAGPEVVNTDGTHPGAVEIGDVTQDGAPDLLVANWESNEVVVLTGRVGGGFGPPERISTGGQAPGSILLPDLDGDGDSDLVVGHAGSNEITVHLNEGPSLGLQLPGRPEPAAPPRPSAAVVRGFTDPARFSLGERSQGLVTADFDEDGNADTAVVQPSALGVAVSRGDGRGNFGEPTVVSTGERPPVRSIRFPHEPQGLAAGDLNGDGHADLVVTMRQRLSDPAPTPSTKGGDEVVVLLGDGHGAFATARGVSTGIRIPVVDVAIGDVTGDGRGDIVTAHAFRGTTEAVAAVLPGDGAAGFGAPKRLRAGRGSAVGVQIADVGADGRADVVVLGAAVDGKKQSGRLSAFRSNGSGGFGNPVHLGLGSADEYGVMHLAAGDVNNDGLPDLAVTSSYPGRVTVVLGAKGRTFGRTISVSTPAKSRAPYGTAVADLTGDGNADLVVAVSEAEHVLLYAGDGRGRFAKPVVLPTGGRGPDSVVVTDVDRDGDADLVALDSWSADLSVRRKEGRP